MTQSGRSEKEPEANLSPAEELQDRPRSGWRKFFGLSIALAIMGFLAMQVVNNWAGVRDYPWSFRPGYLLLSMVCVQCAYFVIARSWRTLLRAVDIRPSYSRAYWIFYISNLGRYIPGKIWQISAAAMIGNSIGLSGSMLAASMVINMLYFVTIGTLIVLASGPFPQPFDSSAYRILAWFFAGTLAVVSLWPRPLIQVVDRLFSRLQLQPDKWRLTLQQQTAVIIQTALAWILMSTGFALFVLSVTSTGDTAWWVLARSYVAAYVLGYVMLLAPGGIGVREGFLTLLLTPIVGVGPAAGLALLSRLWSIGTELIALIPAAIWARKDNWRWPG